MKNKEHFSKMSDQVFIVVEDPGSQPSTAQNLFLISQQARSDENANIPAFPHLTVGRKIQMEAEANYLRNPFGCFINALMNPITRSTNAKSKKGCGHPEIHCGLCLNCGEIIDVAREKEKEKKEKVNKKKGNFVGEGSLDVEEPGSTNSDEEERFDMDKNVFQAFMDTNVPEYIRTNAMKICKEFPRNRIFGLRGANKDRLVFACTYYAYCETEQKVDLNVLGDIIFRTPAGEVTYTGSGKIRRLEQKDINRALKDFSEGQTGFRKKTITIMAFDHIMNFFSSPDAKTTLPEDIFNSYYINEIRNFVNIQAQGKNGLDQDKKISGCYLFCFLEVYGCPCDFNSEIGMRIAKFFDDLKESVFRAARKKILQTYNEYRNGSGSGAAAAASAAVSSVLF